MVEPGLLAINDIEPVFNALKNCKFPSRLELVPNITLLPEVSVVSTALLLAFCTWKALALPTFMELVLVKALAAFFRGTLEDSRLSFNVPEAMFEALRLVKFEPSPVNELEALLNVLAPLKVWLALSLAKLASLDRAALLICTPLI